MELTSAAKKIREPQRKYHIPRQFQDYLTIFLFLAPAFALFIVFLVYPIVQSAYYSMFNWKGFGPAVDFVGLDNFRRILTDKIFMKAVGNAILIVAFSLTIQLPLSLGLAIMVGRDLPGRAFFRAALFMPYVLSEVITAIIWLGLFNPDPQRGFIKTYRLPGESQHRHGVYLCGPDLEIFWITHVVVPGWFAKYSEGNRRGCPDRWCKQVAAHQKYHHPPSE
jgi:raffinose/stachyose/melibiose transport system permease protein